MMNHRFICTLCVFLFAVLQPIVSYAAQLEFAISGLRDPALSNALYILETEKKLQTPLTNEKIEKLSEQAPALILMGMQPFGYFKAKIQLVSLKEVNDDQWVATYQVERGPKLNITQLNVAITGAGRHLKPFQKLLQDFPLKKDQVFKSEAYRNARDSLTELAAELGFLNARLHKHSVVIDRKKYTCSIELILDTGPQFYFGSVNFHDSNYDTHFLDRYVQFNVGDKYTSSALLQLQQNLNNSVYFSSVSVHPQEKKAQNNQVPINIALKDRKSKYYNLGLGIGTDTGPRTTAAFDWFRITDTGHYFTSFLQFSQVQSSLQARYIIPGKNPVTDEYFIGSSIEQEDINHNRGETQKISIGRIDGINEWKRTLSLSIQHDHFSINKAAYETTELLLPSISFQRSYVDNIIFPRRGYSIKAKTLGSARSLASSINFIQAKMDTQWVYSPWDKSRILLRGNLGVTGSDTIEKVPLSLQFFAGGSQSIRGYDYQELGPGRYLMIGNLEYQHQVKGNWWGALFTDAGNAINCFHNAAECFNGDVTPSSIHLGHILKYSIGVGVMYVSPIGPIEVTLAKPMADRNKPIKIQFTMGANL